MVFLVLFLIPMLVALGFFLFNGKKFTLLEFGAQMLAQALLAGICMGLMYWANTSDTEVLNGRITSKAREQVSCAHHHCCRWCTSRSCDSKGRCTTSTYCCGWCDDHPFDVDWAAYTNVPNHSRLTIDRLSSQGLEEPPRWTKVLAGDPASFSASYTNYIKAAPDTLFRREADYEKYAKTIPAYPQQLFDYYNINRVVVVGASLPEGYQAWDNALDQVNADLGPAKQANVVLVFVKGQPEEWFYALQRAWIGGKKNDLVLVTGVDDQMKPLWQNTMAWTTNEMVKVKLRDDIMGMDRISLDTFMPVVKSAVLTYYVRKPMKDFEYLASTITPSVRGWVVSLILGLLLSIGLSIYFVDQDPFQTEESRLGGVRRDPFAATGYYRSTSRTYKKA